MPTRKSFKGYLLLGASFVIAQVPAHAQNAEFSEPQIRGEEQEEASLGGAIVVTAQRRSESVQDVPIAITAFRGEQLQQLNINNSTQITKLTPSLNVSSTGGGQVAQFSIRGVTQNDFADITEAPNAVYIDEGYMASPQAQNFPLFDLERVEVLKGPQGTLFGRNATGGLIHFVSRRPTQELSAYADFTYGSYHQVKVEGAIGGKITQDLSGRIAAYFNRHDPIYENIFPEGIVNNPSTGEPFVPSTSGNDDTFNDNTMAVRARLLWDNGGKITALLTGFAFRQRLSSPPRQVVGSTAIVDGAGNVINTILARNDPLGCQIIVASTGNCRAAFGVNGQVSPEPTTRPVQGGDYFGYIDPDGFGPKFSSDAVLDDVDIYNTRGATAQLTWSLDQFEINSISHYVYNDKQLATDIDGTPTPHSTFAQLSTNKSFSQELRLSGQVDRLKFVTGLYYLHLNVDYDFGITFPQGSPVTDIFFGGTSVDDVISGTQKTNSYSALAQVDYDITDQLTATMGIRSTREQKSFDYVNNFYSNERDLFLDIDQSPLPFESIEYPEVDLRTAKTLWNAKLQLSYQPNPSLLLYAGYNRGVKAGGFNAPVNDFSPPPALDSIPYEPETLHAYEGGVKATVLNGTTNINAAIYYYDYKDYQSFVFTGASGIVRNQPAKYKGGEISLESRPLSGLRILVNLAYVDAEVKNLAVAPGLERDVRPTFTPEWQVSGFVRYDLPMDFSDGNLFAAMDGRYQSNSFYNIRNFDSHLMPGQTTINGQMGWVSDSGSRSLTLFVENAFDETYRITGNDFTTLFGGNEVVLNKPRWFGIRLHVSTR